MNPQAKSKRVFITVHKAASSAESLTEVLRFAVGLSTGMCPHKVCVAFMGDGTLMALKEYNVPACGKYLKSAKAHGVKFYVDEFGMALRSFTPEQMIEGFEVVPTKELMSRLNDCQVHLRV
ncbi:MAG: DsrE family protein [bacterium]|nr:DsrE family protein [bacterium]